MQNHILFIDGDEDTGVMVKTLLAQLCRKIRSGIFVAQHMVDTRML
jgi:hypothetical protein